MRRSTLLAILMIVMCVVLAFITTGCKTNSVVYHEADRSYMNDTIKWQQFLECSKDEGDLGCDSCFYKIYGYYLDDAYETYR